MFTQCTQRATKAVKWQNSLIAAKTYVFADVSLIACDLSIAMSFIAKVHQSVFALD